MTKFQLHEKRWKNCTVVTLRDAFAELGQV